ncbi:MAG: thioredoxin family protein [Ruminococcus sp.]|jgi:thioredoxin 1|nr:thioredoxin family protein [Ruminococcus sp.]
MKIITENELSDVLCENENFLLFFRTDWCTLCDTGADIFAELEKKYQTLKIFVIDFDKSENAANEYGVIGIPTVVTFKDGEMLECYPGMRTEEDYDIIMQNI